MICSNFNTVSNQVEGTPSIHKQWLYDLMLGTGPQTTDYELHPWHYEEVSPMRLNMKSPLGKTHTLFRLVSLLNKSQPFTSLIVKQFTPLAFFLFPCPAVKMAFCGVCTFWSAQHSYHTTIAPSVLTSFCWILTCWGSPFSSPCCLLSGIVDSFTTGEQSKHWEDSMPARL